MFDEDQVIRIVIRVMEALIFLFKFSVSMENSSFILETQKDKRFIIRTYVVVNVGNKEQFMIN